MSPELNRPSFCTFSPQHFIHSIQFEFFLFENRTFFRALDKSIKSLPYSCKLQSANKKQKVCFVFVCLFLYFHLYVCICDDKASTSPFLSMSLWTPSSVPSPGQKFKFFAWELQCCKSANKEQSKSMFCICVIVFVFVFLVVFVSQAPDKSLNSLPENCKVAKVQTRRSWAFAVASCYD